jgi:hypothetical protein
MSELQDIDTLFTNAVANVTPTADVDTNINIGLSHIAEHLKSSPAIKNHVKGIIAMFPVMDSCTCCLNNFLFQREDKDLHFDNWRVMHHFNSRSIQWKYYKIVANCENITFEPVAEIDKDIIDKFRQIYNRKTNRNALYFKENNAKKVVMSVPITEVSKIFRLESKLHLYTRTLEFPVMMDENVQCFPCAFFPIMQL